MGNKKCYICNGNMEMKKTKIDAGWGTYKLTVDGVMAYVCENCGEKAILPNEAKMLQKLSEGFAESDATYKPDLLNLGEASKILRVSNQTIYNMIKRGDIKAYKVGREWRFKHDELMELLQ